LEWQSLTQNPQIWQVWFDRLQHWGLNELVATLLEALGPLNLLGAQVVYIGQPFIQQIVPDGHLSALASVLENPDETRALISVLRQQR
jgi:hypothetical protein